MANSFNLKITAIALSSINIAIPNRTSTTDLVASNVIITKYDSINNVFNSFSAFSLSNVTSSSSNGSTATITPTNDFAQSDLVLIQIIDGASKSDLTAVDFQNAYTSGTAQLDVQIPSDTGNYNLQILGNDDNEFTTPTISVNSFDTIQPLDPTKCSIELVDAKPYLAKYAGKVYKVNITLKDSSGNLVVGNQELVFRAIEN